MRRTEAFGFIDDIIDKARNYAKRDIKIEDNSGSLWGVMIATGNTYYTEEFESEIEEGIGEGSEYDNQSLMDLFSQTYANYLKSYYECFE